MTIKDYNKIFNLLLLTIDSNLNDSNLHFDRYLFTSLPPKKGDIIQS